jgi:hypothetical protein
MCAVVFGGTLPLLVVAVVFATLVVPAARANSVANATAAMALICVARQVSRERRRMPSSRAFWSGYG